MVLEVEYRREDTTFASINEDEVTEFRDTSVFSCRSNARDTSTSPRDSLEELRQSHTSILNVTSDGEESDDDDDDASQGSCLFEDLNEPPRLEEDPSTVHDGGTRQHEAARRPLAVCCPNEERPNNKNMITDWLDTSTNSLRNVTESFAESLCAGTVMEAPCGSFQNYTFSGADRSLQHQMELDILALLGCSDNPTDEELETWATPLLCPMDYGQRGPPKERAQVIRSRVQRVHRYRKERQIMSPQRLGKSRSLDNSMLNETNVSTETSFHDAIGSFLGFEDDLPIGHGLEPIQPFEHDGYDSDPEVSFRREEGEEEQPREIFDDPLNVSAISRDVERGDPASEIVDAVQESLNYTWALTWHPTKENMQALGCYDDNKKNTNFEPQCIQLWFERGHILHHGHTIVEPRFMWRQFLTRDNGMTVPHQMRLLNVCRAIAVEHIDRSKYPLARTSHSFVLRMVSGDEFVFEAASESERDTILQRWKLVVARLATLAVFEDLNAMQTEFFSTPVDPQAIYDD